MSPDVVTRMPLRRLFRWICAGLAMLVVEGCAAPSAKDKVDPPPAPELKPADKGERARVHLELASYYFGRGQGTTALDEVKQALAADATIAGGLNLQGLIYGSLDQPQAAEESFRRALQTNSRDGDAMHNYGWFLCQQKRYADANNQFTAALAQPAYRDTIRTLLAQGVCQARNLQWAEAERTLSRAYEFDPSNPTTAVNLSEVLYRRGEYERALFYIKRVNDRDNLISAQTLWLAARIANRLGDQAQVQALGNRLRDRFPQSPETLLFERGRFNE